MPTQLSGNESAILQYRELFRWRAKMKAKRSSKRLDPVTKARIIHITARKSTWRSHSKGTREGTARLQEAENRTYLCLHLILPSIEGPLGVTPIRVVEFLAEIPQSVNAGDESIDQEPEHKHVIDLLPIILAAMRPLKVLCVKWI